MTPARPDLEGIEPYLSPQVEARIRLNTNECPYPPPQGFLQDLQESLRSLPFNRYPDREVSGLREALGASMGHDAAGVWVANGSNEIIQQLCLAFGGAGRRAIVFEPTFMLHAQIPRITGTEVVVGRLDEAFRLPGDAAAMCQRYRPAMVFVCSPNNPTGNAQPLEAIEAICGATDALVIVDEAYGEFGGDSSRPLLDRFVNLVVVKTFSKAFALATARIGYCLARQEVVEDLRRVRLPYHLSGLSQAAGMVALAYRKEALEIVDRVRDERARLFAELGRLEGVEVFPSDANFLLFRTEVPAASLWKTLLDHDALVRDVSWMPGLERCLRVSVGTREETDGFLGALPRALQEAA